MMEGQVTYDAFCAQAKELVDISNDVMRKRGHSGAQEGLDTGVMPWEWREGPRKHLRGNAYIVSRNNVRSWESFQRLQAHARSDESDLPEEEESDPDPAAIDTHITTDTLLVDYHVVFHTIYETPILYFRLYRPDGSPIRFEVIEGRPEDLIISMENHPIENTPFSFIHPCETASAMQLLLSQETHSHPQVSPNYLLTWLSLVQPLTHQSPWQYVTTEK